MKMIDECIEKFVEEKIFLKGKRKEYLFSLMCANYYFYDDELSNSTAQTIFVDGKNDGGLDLVLNDPKTDNLMLIQSKLTDNLNKDHILDIFQKMSRAIDDYQNGNRNRFTDSVRRALAEGIDNLPEDGEYHLVLFTSYNPSEKYREEIKAAIENLDISNNYYIDIYYYDNILEQIEYIKNPKDYVKFDRIKYDRKSGILRYKDNGIMVNLSSRSLLNLYEKYKSQGLFDQNLRYFVKQDKVDSSMEDTLNNQIDNFWYFNNGIIIGCDNFLEDGNEIKLENFSIINGCQTTNIIGNYDGKNRMVEFWIPCKIIASRYEDNREFIESVAEASNTQKPINFRDLVSNRPEQKKLKKDLLNNNPSIHMEIKRGEKKASKSQFREKWQRTTNEEIAQLIASIIYQKPGTARNQKKSLFDTTKTREELYNKIFKKGISIETIVDLLKLSNYYEKSLDDFVKKGELNKEQINVAKNGKLFFLALIGLLIKAKRNVIDIKRFNSFELEERRNLISDKAILTGTLISNYPNDDFEALLKQLIKRLITYVAASYSNDYGDGKVTSVSNYFKADIKYYDTIVPYVLNAFINNVVFEEECKKYFELFDD